MNILILSWRDPKHPIAGGAEQVVLEHAKGWIEAGNGVTWFSSRFRGSNEFENIDGVDFIRKGHQYLGVQLTAFFYLLKNKNRYDLIIDQFHGVPFFTPLYIKKSKLALIQEVAGKVWLLNPLPFPFNIVVGIIGFLFEPFIFLFYKNVPFMTGSESAKNEVSKFGIPLKNITVVPHGVILPRSKTKHSNSRVPVITYLGILSKDKGIEDAIKCFAILNELENYQFWVIGKPETHDYSEKIKKQIKRLNLENKIKFWGYVNQSKKFNLLSRSSLLINPSIHEGWGLVNIEANVVGTPVISYNSAGLVDSIKDGQSGIILKNNSPEEMASQVSDLLKNNDEYNKLVKGAIDWSKNFSWKKSIAKSLVLINRIVQ